jgi:hypothetical protein
MQRIHSIEIHGRNCIDDEETMIHKEVVVTYFSTFHLHGRTEKSREQQAFILEPKIGYNDDINL